MKDLTQQTQDQKALSSVPAPAGEMSDVRTLAAKLEMTEAAIQRARDTACLFAYLTQDIPDSSKRIELDLQALRGVMARMSGDLDDALEALDTAQDLFSLIAKKPTL